MKKVNMMRKKNLTSNCEKQKTDLLEHKVHVRRIIRNKIVRSGSELVDNF